MSQKNCFILGICLGMQIACIEFARHICKMKGANSTEFDKKNKYPIICTGAALSFFTRDQAPINAFFDEVYLGWLIRIIFNPKIFLKRYFLSLKLLVIFIKYFDTIEKK